MCFTNNIENFKNGTLSEAGFAAFLHSEFGYDIDVKNAWNAIHDGAKPKDERAILQGSRQYRNIDSLIQFAKQNPLIKIILVGVTNPWHTEAILGDSIAHCPEGQIVKSFSYTSGVMSIPTLADMAFSDQRYSVVLSLHRDIKNTDKASHFVHKAYNPDKDGLVGDYISNMLEEEHAHARIINAMCVHDIALY